MLLPRLAIAQQSRATTATETARPTGGTSREANLILSCRRTSIWDPPVGGTFQFQIFIRASSPKIWLKYFRGEGGRWRGRGWPVLGYLLGKNYRRRDRDHLVPPAEGWMQQYPAVAEVCYPLPLAARAQHRTAGSVCSFPGDTGPAGGMPSTSRALRSRLRLHHPFGGHSDQATPVRTEQKTPDTIVRPWDRRALLFPTS